MLIMKTVKKIAVNNRYKELKKGITIFSNDVEVGMLKRRIGKIYTIDRKIEKLQNKKKILENQITNILKSKE